jgi:hypothetical protein
MIALGSLNHIIFSVWIDREGRFSDSRHQNRDGVLHDDIQRSLIDGLVNFVRFRVLLEGLFRCPLLIPERGRPDCLVQADGKAPESIPTCQCLSLESWSVVLGVGQSCKRFTRFPVFWSLS